jgi:DNA repair exonuclease SbcCD ATPase subunit
MASFHRLRRLSLFLVPVFLSTSCSLRYTPQPGEDLSQDTVHLEKMIENYGADSVHASAHLQLARLYANSKNPKMDYKKALREFETYRSLAPEEAKADEIQNWLSILRALDRSQKELQQKQETISLLTGENAERKMELEQQVKKMQKMQANFEKLQESNTRLKKTIEGLETLDLRIENKRKSVK